VWEVIGGMALRDWQGMGGILIATAGLGVEEEIWFFGRVVCSDDHLAISSSSGRVQPLVNNLGVLSEMGWGGSADMIRMHREEASVRLLRWVNKARSCRRWVVELDAVKIRRRERIILWIVVQVVVDVIVYLLTLGSVDSYSSTWIGNDVEVYLVGSMDVRDLDISAGVFSKPVPNDVVPHPLGVSS
jgi:hypothetical protein